MKKIIVTTSALFLMIILISGYSYSQNSISGNLIKGIVIEKSTGKALESATVQVFRTGDSVLIGGTLTDALGKFEVGDISNGNYNVKISFIGYSTAVAKDIKIGSNKKEIDLGIVKLEASSATTQEIQVEDEAPQMTLEAGKKVFDVKKDLNAQNGTITDLLRNLPSVDVDNDGNVSLRGGGNVKILIDGKPSALLSNGPQALQNIPASVVDKIEVINNPSAKYEAEGISGIINILMKPNESIGYNGNFKANSGTDDKYNFSMGGSMKKNKLSLNANYSYWNYFMPGHSIVDRTVFSNSINNNINTELNWDYKGVSHYGSFGADYDFDKLNTFSIVANYFNYDRHIKSHSYLNISDINHINTFNNFSLMDDGRNGYNLDVTVTYTKKFDTKGKDFTTFLNYSGRKEDNPVSYDNYSGNTRLLQNQSSDYKFNFINWQADYTHPFSETVKLETGLKSNPRFINGNYTFSNLDNNTGQWISDISKNNDADYKDVISAFYGTLSGQYKDFNYQAGIRGEHTYIDFSILQGSQKYHQNYFNLFPSVSLSQKLGPENQFQLTYSRRINRPGLFQLNPFVSKFDDYTLRTGNPYLSPEYVNSFELGYTRSWNFLTATVTGFYRNSTDEISFFTTVDTNGVTLLHPENAGTSNSSGVEFIYQGSFAKWWTFNGSASYFDTHLFNNSGNFTFDKSYNSWNARLSTTASLPGIADIQFSYYYFGQQETPQGTVDPAQMMNLAITKNFFDKKLILGLRINDMFNQQKFNINTGGSYYTQTIWQKQGTRAAFLTLTFNFGEQFSSKAKNTAQRKQRENEGEIMNSGN